MEKNDSSLPDIAPVTKVHYRSVAYSLAIVALILVAAGALIAKQKNNPAPTSDTYISSPTPKITATPRVTPTLSPLAPATITP